MAVSKQTEETNLLVNNLNENEANVPFISQSPKQILEQPPQIQILPIHVPLQNTTCVVESPASENSIIPHNQFAQQLQNSQLKTTPPQLDSAGTQKTAEKMRRDEGMYFLDFKYTRLMLVSVDQEWHFVPICNFCITLFSLKHFDNCLLNFIENIY